MAELNERQMSVLESYKRPASILPMGGSRLSSSGRYSRYRWESGSGTVREEILAARGNAKQLRRISREQHKVNSGYIEIIEYFKNFYYFRYITVPLLKKGAETANKERLREISREMVDVVDMMSLETQLPKLIEKGLIDGVVYLYMYKKNGMPNLIVLPEEYCERYRETNYDTETIRFDFNYFLDLMSSYKDEVEQEDIEKELSSVFPKELINQYKKYVNKDGSVNHTYRYQELDIQRATAIPFHKDAIPPKILVSAAKESYDEQLTVEKERGAAQIDSILVIEVPTDADGIPIFDATETAAIQSLMSQQLQGIAGLKVLTPIGEASILKPQENESVKNETVSKAFNQIFEEAMINPELFRADTDYALEVSLNRDAAFLWTILERFMNYFNLALNKLYNFDNYALYVQLLPVTKYNSKEQQDGYRRAAEYGIGKLEAVVATGIKQSVIYDKAKLEEALELDDILKPLQSSHTRSAQELKNIKEGGVKEETKEEEKDDEKSSKERVEKDEED